MMNRQTKHLLLYIVLLMLTHGIALAVIYVSGFMDFRNEFLNFLFGERFFHYSLGLFPLLLVPLVFGSKIRSWQEYGLYLLVTVIVW